MLDDEPLHIRAWEPRKRLRSLELLVFVCYFLTAGILAVVAQWPWLKRSFLLFTSKPAKDCDADFVIIDNADGSWEACPVEAVAERPLELLEGEDKRAASRRPVASIPREQRMVVYRHTRYLFLPATESFVLLDPEAATGGASPTGSDGCAQAVGLTPADASERLRRFGRNVIDIPIPHAGVLLLRECLHPFVAFQIFSVILWLTEDYIGYSIFIFVTAMASAVTSFWEVRKNLRSIRALSLYTTSLHALRRAPGADAAPLASLLAGAPSSCSLEPADSASLVPGDIIEVTSGMKLPADCVLLTGSVTVNEAMLTGESTVVIKAPLPSAGGPAAASWPGVNLVAAEARNTLFGGSLVVQLRVPPGQRVLAAVARTGFDSVKGRLVLSILHPKAAHFKFMEQSFVFIGLLFAAAMVGLGITIERMAFYGKDVGKMVQRGCDMVTIVVPPALPLALTVGVAYALVALRKRRIFCISPPRVNLAGKVNCFCFDKTGTLTSEGLELACIRPVAPSAHTDSSSPASQRFGGETSDPSVLSDLMVALLASCHTLTYVDSQGPPAPAAGGTEVKAAAGGGKELAGDPLELKTFHFTGATMTEPHTNPAGGSSGHGRGAGDADVGAPAGYLSFVSVPASSATGASDPRSLFASPAKLHAPTAGGGGVRWAGYVTRQFEFVPALQRMGVLVQATRKGATPGTVLSFVKGSPEVIASLCDPASMPADYAATLARYTHQGYRVLGAGYKPMAAAEVEAAAAAAGTDSEALRRACESRLRFLGFIVLENALKPETAGVISVLTREACMPVHMVTGDNPVSAVCIARQCGIVEDGRRVFIGDLAGELSAHALGSDGEGTPRSPSGGDPTGGTGVVWHDVDDERCTLDPLTLLPAPGSRAAASHRPYRLAMTGRAFSHLLASHRAAVAAAGGPAATADRDWPFHRAILNTAVFARMNPENKEQVVEELQGTGLYVGFCGDGANDALGLRQSHVGVSLSQVEASVSAPFTSMVPNISCVPLVLSEGRGALTTSFCLFQFMALYSTIQFANAVFAVLVNSFLSNNEYLYQDLFMVFVLALTLGSTPANPRLTRKRPSGRLLSPFNLVLCAGFILLTFTAQGIVYAAVQGQPWYNSAAYPTTMPVDDTGLNPAVPVTSSVFLVAMFQYVAVAIIFSVGHPWKQPTWTNLPFCGWLAIVTVVSVGVLFARDPRLYELLGAMMMPAEWHVALAAYAAMALGFYAVFIAAVWYAKKAGGFAWLARAVRRVRGLPLSVKPHKRMRAEWRSQMARLSGPAAEDGPSTVEVALKSPLAAVARGAVASAGIVRAASRPISAARPMEDDTAGSFGSPPPLGGLPARDSAASGAAYHYSFGDESTVTIPLAGVDRRAAMPSASLHLAPPSSIGR